ncbi:hypothetical protein AB0G15_05790 [Streptosporangium sp. NPDC023825]|uniref:hypothetical protein n=1 Tax=Streptosporangium sp. NPDC023825 TaxID=3154909 RepID=UPI00341A25FE
MNDGAIIENALKDLNALPNPNGATWVAMESSLSQTTIKNGHLRRVELWLLTPEALADQDS